MTKRGKTALWIIGVLAALISVKAISIHTNVKQIGSFETEKTDILRRRNYLVSKIVTTPEKLLFRMPAAIGEQFQGEWALYSCSMLSASMVNMAYFYPETKSESLTVIDSLIKIVMTPEIRKYDRIRWGEDPLMTLDGEESHISYWEKEKPGSFVRGLVLVLFIEEMCSEAFF